MSILLCLGGVMSCVAVIYMHGKKCYKSVWDELLS